MSARHTLNELAEFIKPTLASLDSSNTDDATITQLQLVSIFHSLDSKGEMLLNRQQVTDALKMIGVHPSEHTIEKYFYTGDGKKSANKVDLQSFVSITYDEVNNHEPPDFHLLFDVIGATTKSISLQQLRHLLVGTKSPTRMTLKEFDEFLITLGLSNEQRMSLNGEISTEVLVKKLLLPQQNLMLSK